MTLTQEEMVERKRAANRRTRQKRMAEGRCSRCGRPECKLMPSYSTGVLCLAYLREARIGRKRGLL